MKDVFFLILFACFAGFADAAADVELEARRSVLKFQDNSELSSSSDGPHLLSITLSFNGSTYDLKGDVLAGLDYPDLTSIKLKLVGVNECGSSPVVCVDYSMPLIEMAVSGIPEDQECAEGCLVKFVLKGATIHRKTSSQRSGKILAYPERLFPRH